MYVKHLSPTGTSCSISANEAAENWEPRANNECLEQKAHDAWDECAAAVPTDC